MVQGACSSPPRPVAPGGDGVRRVRDNPRQHRGHVSFSREPLTMQAWSYSGKVVGNGKERSGSRDFYVAFVDKQGHTLCQGRFLMKTTLR